ncbi:MAG: NAD(P)-dependent oxidoreductase [Pirellulales bacterium]|nr:NAD(P)-dependent oxidoreductase [Pirellulales bacterium]
MKVLVIGGAGYVGSAVTHAFWQAGHEVTVLDRMLFGAESLVPLLDRPRFRLVAGDIRDPQSLDTVVPGHDAVLLLAAIVGEPACNRDPETARTTNLDGARNVLHSVRQCGVGQFVFASTCSNYGISDVGMAVDENAPLKPLSVYSETKVQAEQEILAAATTDFHPTVLRLSTAFGVSPRMRFDLLVSDFVLAAHRDRKIIIYGEQFWRPFVHVNDIAQAMQSVLETEASTVSGKVFNIGGNGNNVQKIALAEMVQQQVPGTEIETVHRDTDPRSYRVDFTRAANELNFVPQWSVQGGVAEVDKALRMGVWSDPSSSRYYN